MRLAVLANPAAQQRTATLTVAGKGFTVTQLPAETCRISINPRSTLAAPSGGADVIAVEANPQCAWSASATANWITINGNGRGTGSGEVGYTVAANTSGETRKAAITIEVLTVDVTQGWGDFSVLNGASLRYAPIALQSIVSLRGREFAAASESATEPLPSLAGVSVQVWDSAGVEHPANLLLVSPDIISFIAPAEAPTGTAVVGLRRSDGVQLLAETQVSNASPGLFSADESGRGAALGSVRNVDADGQVRKTASLSARQGSTISPIPIQHGPDPQRTIVSLSGTGFRFAQSVELRAGNKDCEIVSFGPDPENPTLANVQFVLPRSLAGSGELAVFLRADSLVSNSVNITVGQPLAVPRLTTITPASVDAGSTAQFRIAGTGLTAVALRVLPADGVTISGVQSSPSEITATIAVSPSAVPGSRTVTALNEIGESNGLTLTIRPPTAVIRSLDPASRPRGSEPFQLQIGGDNLAGVSEIVFTPASGISVSGLVVNPNAVTATVQIAGSTAIGRLSVAVRSAAGLSNTLSFDVLAAPPPAPVISQISPSSGSPGRLILYNPDFVITGSGLDTASAIEFEPADGIGASIATKANDRIVASLNLDSAAALGRRSVRARTPGGQSNAVTFEIVAAPVNAPSISSVTLNPLRFTSSGALGGTVEATGSLQFSDPDNDVRAGTPPARVRIRSNLVSNLSRNACTITADVTTVGEGSGARSLSFRGSNDAVFRSTGRIELFVSLIDLAGNESNTVFLTVSEWYCGVF